MDSSVESEHELAMRLVQETGEPYLCQQCMVVHYPTKKVQADGEFYCHLDTKSMEALGRAFGDAQLELEDHWMDALRYRSKLPMEDNPMVYEVCVLKVDKAGEPTEVLVQPTIVLVKDDNAATVAGARLVTPEVPDDQIMVLVRPFR